LIFSISDGIHDNLDPQELGKLPKDFGKEYNTWEEFNKKDPQEIDKIKTESRTALLGKLLSQNKTKGTELTVSDITNILLAHCREVTQKSRDFMEANSTKRLPSDYFLYPGKLDHATCLAFKVSGPRGNNIKKSK